MIYERRKSNQRRVPRPTEVFSCSVPNHNTPNASGDNTHLHLPMLYAPSGVRVSPVWTPAAAASPLAETMTSVDSRQHRKGRNFTELGQKTFLA